LSVAGTTVSITVIRRVSAWWAGALLLAGVLVALASRSIVGRRAAIGVRAQVAGLAAPTEPAARPEWVATAVSARDRTVQDLGATVSADALWAAWQVRGTRWLFVPAADAAQRVTSTAGAAAASAAVLARWDRVSAAALDALAHGGVHAGLTPQLSARADAIRSDPAAGMQEPDNGPRRTGIPGLDAVLQEAEAIGTVGELAQRVRGLRADLDALGAVGGTATDRALGRRWAADRARADLDLAGIEQQLYRAGDAPALLAGGLLDRVRAVSDAIDRLRPSPARRLAAAVPVDGDVPPLPVPSGPWPRVKAAVHWFVTGDHPAVVGDIWGVVVALAVVLAAGLGTLYRGKVWGTPGDMVVTLLAALAGSLALNPLLTALDRLASPTKTTAKAPSSS
jgi:hypothetical protein